VLPHRFQNVWRFLSADRHWLTADERTNERQTTVPIDCWCASPCPDMPRHERPADLSRPRDAHAGDQRGERQPVLLQIQAVVCTVGLYKEERIASIVCGSVSGHTRHFDFIPFCSNHVRFAKAYLQEPLSDAADDVEVEVQERQRGLRDALQLRYGDIGCILCGSNKEPPIIIMCRGCDSGFHPTCVPVDPRLIAVLEEDW